MSRAKRWALVLGIVLGTLLWSTGAWALGGFTLEFQTVGEGGSSSVSASYEAEQQIMFVGAAAMGQSATYEATSVLEESQAEPPSSVMLWMLF